MNLKIFVYTQYCVYVAMNTCCLLGISISLICLECIALMYLHAYVLIRFGVAYVTYLHFFYPLVYFLTPTFLALCAARAAVLLLSFVILSINVTFVCLSILKCS